MEDKRIEELKNVQACIQYKSVLDCDKLDCTGCRMFGTALPEPTCPRYAGPLCDVCTPDDKQPGCYKDIPEFGFDVYEAPVCNTLVRCYDAAGCVQCPAKKEKDDTDPCTACEKDQGSCGLAAGKRSDDGGPFNCFVGRC